MVRRGLTFQEKVLVGSHCQWSQAPFSLPHTKLSSIPLALPHQRHFTCGTHLGPLLPHQSFALRPNGPRGLLWVLYRLPLSWCPGHTQHRSLCLPPFSTPRYQPTTILLPPPFAVPKARVGGEGEHSLLLTPHLHLFPQTLSLNELQPRDILSCLFFAERQ